METTEYYNAKPSKIGNIGLDVAGAKRMNFDTYETVEEREVKERKKKQDKLIGAIKLELKAVVLSESPSVEKIIELLTKQFELSYGVLPVIEIVRAHIDDIRLNVQGKPCSSLINKVVNSYNKFNRDTRRLKSSPSYYLRKMAEKYQPN